MPQAKINSFYSAVAFMGISLYLGMFSLSHSVVQGDLELLDSLGYRLKPYNTALEQTKPYLMNPEYKLLRLSI